MKNAILSIGVICFVVVMSFFTLDAIVRGNAWAAGVGLAMLYFLPACIAGARGHHQFAPILVLNFFLGWTLIGWVGALAMSVSHQPSHS